MEFTEKSKIYIGRRQSSFSPKAKGKLIIIISIKSAQVCYL
jgi:hypothetical protein